MRTVVLVSCVKKKLNQSAKAKDLYQSTLFRAQRTFAEKFGDDWYILSAKHGLLDPESVIEPYEQTLKSVGASRRLEWSFNVYAQLQAQTDPDDTIIITAGENYCRDLVPLLAQRGHKIERPAKGLSMGYIPGRLYALVAQASAKAMTN